MTLHGRPRITKRLAWIAALTLASLGTSLQAGDITGIVAFGDSLSDTGNTFLAAGTPPAPYYQGHYSNGPIWLEYLASREGVAPPTPSLKPGGTDYAWGGAQTGDGASFMGTPNIGTQIGAFIASGNTLSNYPRTNGCLCGVGSCITLAQAPQPPVPVEPTR